MVYIKNHPQSTLPPGFRFHPTDEELILHYLKKKVASIPFSVSIIADVDIYKFDPWDLPGVLSFSFFFFYQSNTGKVNFMFMCKLYNWLLFVLFVVDQLKLPLGRKSGTFSVLEIESTQMELGRTEPLHPGIGRRQAQIRSF